MRTKNRSAHRLHEQVRAHGQPLVFSPAAWEKYFFNGAKVTVHDREYRCELYGTIEPDRLLVTDLLEHPVTPQVRRAIKRRLARKGLVLLGESTKLPTDFCTPQRHPDPYVFLLARKLDGRLTFSCESIQDSRFITHPVALLREKQPSPGQACDGARQEGRHAD